MKYGQVIGGELYSIPKVLKSNNLSFEDEKIGIIFPTYLFSAPYIVREFIEKVTLKSPYIFAILTYGNKVANGADWFVQYAKKYNITIHYSNSLKMVDNFLPGFDMNKETSKEKNIEKNLDRILKDITENRRYIKPRTVLPAETARGSVLSILILSKT